MSTFPPQDPTEPDLFSLKDFRCIGPLGRGASGTVHLAREKKSACFVALKSIDSKTPKHRIRTEIECMGLLHRHPYILSLYTWFHNKDRVYLVMEYARCGNLYHQLRQNKTLRFSQVARIIASMASALHYCHKNNIVHRDLKPENILLTSAEDECEFRLADFGLSMQKMCKSERMVTLCGTLDYLSPEVLDKSSYDDRVDIWALGVLAYELVVGKPPFGSNSPSTVQQNIRLVHCEPESLHFPSFVDPNMKRLIRSILQVDPDKRPTLKEIFYHDSIQKYSENIVFDIEED